MNLNALNVTRDRLLAKVIDWLAALSSMRLHGPHNYRQDGDFIRRAHDLLRMLHLPNAPREPFERDGGWTIDRQIDALENVRLFLELDLEPCEVAAKEPEDISAEYRDGSKANGELLTVKYCSRKETFGLSGSALSRNALAIKTRIKHGRAFVYQFDVVTAMSAAKHHNN